MRLDIFNPKKKKKKKKKNKKKKQKKQNKTVKSPRNVFRRTAHIPNSSISPPYQKKLLNLIISLSLLYLVLCSKYLVSDPCHWFLPPLISVL